MAKDSKSPTKSTDLTSKRPPEKLSESQISKKSQRAFGLLSRIIRIQVGKRLEPFQVHQDILSASSPFFRKTCNGPWKESKEGWIELPEDDPEIFEIYLTWLYLGTVEIPSEDELFIFSRTFHAYKFGDKILDASFKNSVIDFLIKVVSTINKYPTSLAKDIYAHLPSSSCLRRLYVDFWVWAASLEWFVPTENTKDMIDGPIEFFIELSKRQVEVGPRRPLGKGCPWIADPCQYHEHPDGMPKCIKKASK